MEIISNKNEHLQQDRNWPEMSKKISSVPIKASKKAAIAFHDSHSYLDSIIQELELRIFIDQVSIE